MCPLLRNLRGRTREDGVCESNCSFLHAKIDVHRTVQSSASHHPLLLFSWGQECVCLCGRPQNHEEWKALASKVLPWLAAAAIVTAAGVAYKHQTCEVRCRVSFLQTNTHTNVRYT